MNALVQTMQSMGSIRIALLSFVGVVLLSVFAFLSVRIASPVMSPLYSGLSAEDAGVIITELGSMGISFETSNNGSEILVGSSEVLGVRMALAQKGLPRQGSIVGYEVFDKSDKLGTSQFVHNVNLIRAMEGELGRTISSLASIKSARVHLVIPKKALFQKNKLEPSASVVLALNNHSRMPKEETTAVKHLVSSAVPGLKPSRVTIIDSSGKLLARGSVEDPANPLAMTSTNAAEYKAAYEARLKQTVISMLEQTVGLERVHAEVSADISFDRKITNEEIFDPDGQVARSVQSSTETEKSTRGGSGGTVSVAENLPEGAADNSAPSSDSDSAEKVDEITNFEISKTVTNYVSEVGVVRKLSVAVLVDGKYENNGSENTYIPRTDEELDQLKTLVQSAIGFDASRGDTVEIVNMPFSNDMSHLIVSEGPFDWLKRDLDSILKTVVVGIVAILAILLIIRPLVNKAFEISTSDLEVENAEAQANMELSALEGLDGLDLESIQNRMDVSSTKKINDLVENNPQETLNVIRAWLSEK